MSRKLAAVLTLAMVALTLVGLARAAVTAPERAGTSVSAPWYCRDIPMRTLSPGSFQAQRMRNLCDRPRKYISAE